MNETVKRISEILHEVSEIHHTVYKIVDGNDSDWAIWYAHWLIRLSNFSKVIESTPIESELIYLLIKLDKEYAAEKRELSWEVYYAEAIVQYYQKNKKCLACSQLFRLNVELEKHTKEQHGQGM